MTTTAPEQLDTAFRVTDAVIIERALDLLGFNPDIVDLRDDGSVLLRADPDIEIPVLKVGHYAKLVAIDARHFGGPSSNGKKPPTTAAAKKKAAAEEEDAGWDTFARWFVDVLAVFDIKRERDDLPSWTLDPRLRIRLLRHWRTVPFVRPGRSGTPTT